MKNYHAFYYEPHAKAYGCFICVQPNHNLILSTYAGDIEDINTNWDYVGEIEEKVIATYDLETPLIQQIVEYKNKLKKQNKLLDKTYIKKMEEVIENYNKSHKSG